MPLLVGFYIICPIFCRPWLAGIVMPHIDTPGVCKLRETCGRFPQRGPVQLDIDSTMNNWSMRIWTKFDDMIWSESLLVSFVWEDVYQIWWYDYLILSFFFFFSDDVYQIWWHMFFIVFGLYYPNCWILKIHVPCGEWWYCSYWSPIGDISIL